MIERPTENKAKHEENAPKQSPVQSIDRLLWHKKNHNSFSISSQSRNGISSSSSSSSRRNKTRAWKNSPINLASNNSIKVTWYGNWCVCVCVLVSNGDIISVTKAMFHLIFMNIELNWAELIWAMRIANVLWSCYLFIILFPFSFLFSSIWNGRCVRIGFELMPPLIEKKNELYRSRAQ